MATNGLKRTTLLYKYIVFWVQFQYAYNFYNLSFILACNMLKIIEFVVTVMNLTAASVRATGIYHSANLDTAIEWFSSKNNRALKSLPNVKIYI